MGKVYKAVFLDWDDTIGDWQNAARRSQQDIYNKYRISEFYTTFDAWFEAYEVHNIELWHRYGASEISKEFLQRDRFLYPLVAALGGSEVLYRSVRFVALADAMGKDFLELTNRYFCLLPDAEQVVRYLAAKYPLTVISNGFGEVQHYKLAHSGLQDLFTHVVISDEVGINKPQAGLFEEALRRNGVSKDEAVMIGDSYFSDITGAKNAGIDQIWLVGDAPLSEEKAAGTATYKVPRLADVMTIL